MQHPPRRESLPDTTTTDDSPISGRRLNSRMLQWHYRSRDPSLIRVSNQEFYGDGLILPPSPLQEDPAYGLRFTRVDGVSASTTAEESAKIARRERRSCSV